MTTNLTITPTIPTSQALTTKSTQVIPTYFKSSDFVLYNADCLEVMKRLPENSIDLVFADPPYFLSTNITDLSYKGEWDLSKGVKQDILFQAN